MDGFSPQRRCSSQQDSRFATDRCCILAAHGIVGEANFSPHILAKALTLLECFDGEEHDFSLTELARRVGAAPGSIYSIMYTLERFGYIVRDPGTKRYNLGLKALVHAHAVLTSLDVREIARPVLKRLARELGNVHSQLMTKAPTRPGKAADGDHRSVIGDKFSYCTLGKVFLLTWISQSEPVGVRARRRTWTIRILLPRKLPCGGRGPRTFQEFRRQLVRRAPVFDWEPVSHLGIVHQLAPRARAARSIRQGGGRRSARHLSSDGLSAVATSRRRSHRAGVREPPRVQAEASSEMRAREEDWICR
jgi:hypothetical protein